MAEKFEPPDVGCYRGRGWTSDFGRVLETLNQDRVMFHHWALSIVHWETVRPVFNVPTRMRMQVEATHEPGNSLSPKGRFFLSPATYDTMVHSGLLWCWIRVLSAGISSIWAQGTRKEVG